MMDGWMDDVVKNMNAQTYQLDNTCTVKTHITTKEFLGTQKKWRTLLGRFSSVLFDLRSCKDSYLFVVSENNCVC